MAVPQLKQDATELRLTGRAIPQGGCTGPAREAALARLRAMGLPSRRDEYWKYTRPETLVQPDPPKAALFEDSEAPMFSDLDRLKIVFVDGVFDPAASDDLALEGVRVDRIADLCARDIHWAKELYGVLEARGQNPVPRALAAFNTAFATDGLAIHVGQAQVEQHHVGIAGNDAADRGIAVDRNGHLAAFRLEHRLQHRNERRLVIDQKDMTSRHGALSLNNGSRIVTEVPSWPATGDVNSMEPLNASTNPFAIARPRPLPCGEE